MLIDGGSSHHFQLPFIDIVTDSNGEDIHVTLFKVFERNTKRLLSTSTGSIR